MTDALLDATTAYWRQLAVASRRYVGRWREMVHRSAITLKLLTHEPTGAIIAAPTTSLPEYDWREAVTGTTATCGSAMPASALYALLRLGFTDEARAFIGWLSERLGDERDDDERRPRPAAGALRHRRQRARPTRSSSTTCAGTATPQPVRVGNAAVDQLQLDIYGELIDSVYLFNKYGPGISSTTRGATSSRSSNG